MKIHSIASPKHILEAKKLLAKTFACIGLKTADFDVYFESPGLYLSMIAIQNKKVVGIAIAQKSNGYFAWMAVDKSLQRKGIGATLSKAIEANLKKNKLKHISLDTRNRFKSAIVMYLKNAYDITGTYVHADGEVMVRMRKKLR